MPLQFTTVEEPSFDRGIDARSAENQIKAGFARDLVNVDIVESRIRKRKGYSSHAGNIPVRVLKLSQATPNKVTFTLDSSIDLTRVTPGPIMVYGKSGSITTGGPFTDAGNTYHYYDTWTSNLRKPFNVGSGSITAPFTEHAIDTTDMFVGLALSTSMVNLSGETTFTDSVTINSTTKDITANYVNSTGSIRQTFLYYKDQTAVGGQSYVFPPPSDTFTIVANDTDTITIPAGTHNLDNYNIVYQLYQNVSGNWEQVKPDFFRVNSTDGEVTIGITNGTSSPIDYKVILSSTPLSQTRSVAIESGGPIENTSSTRSVIIPDIESPFLFFSVYRTKADGSNVNLLEEVIINDSLYNDVTKEWTLGWTPSGPDDQNFFIYYQYGSVRTNEISVTDSISSPAIDNVPQLVIYGLDHKTAYGDDKKVGTRGWVTHLDSYRSPRTAHIVAGLGGNLFSALPSAEAPAPVMLPTWYASLSQRIGTSQTIGPAFYESGSIPTSNKRTRGYYTFTGGLFHWATVSKVEYQPSTGYTKYTLKTPNGAKTTGSSPIVAGDQLTIEKMSHSRHNGIFEIVDVVDTGIGGASGELVLYVKNPKLATIDYNDTATSGRGGVFSDRITLQEASPFLANDKLLSSSWGEETNITVYKDSLTEVRVLDQSGNVLPSYTGNVIPVVSTDGFAATGSIVIGSTSYTYTSKTPTSFTITSSITVSSGTKVYTKEVWVNQCFNYQFLNSGLFLAGQRTSATVNLRSLNGSIGSGNLNVVAGDVLYYSELDREVVVTSVDAVNNKVTLDESITWYDNQSLPPSFSVTRRWFPIETPTPSTSDDLLKSTVVRHFSALPYDNQPFLRSAMVQNNMYLTNGFDEVYKYDGANLYRAGMIPWQPGLFCATENVAGGGIPLAAVSLDSPEIEGKTIKVLKAEGAKVKAGDILRVTFSTGTTQDVTVAEVKEVGDFAYLSFTDVFAPPAGATISSLRGVYYAYYFFRLNIKDRNGVITASAVTGYESFIATIAPEENKSQRVLLRLVGLPAWDHYDYRNGNIELEIYRSAWSMASLGNTPIMYRLKTEPLTFIKNGGYIDFTDSYGNNFLSEEDTDVVARILSPRDIPVGWDEPVRSKYLTTIDNRLVLANVTDWPTLSVNFIADKDTNYSNFAGQTFLFRRDSADADTTTNMVDRVKYELVNSSTAKTIYPSLSDENQFKFTTTTSLPTSGSGVVSAGSWVYVYHNTVTSGSRVAFTTVAGSQFIFPTAPLTVPPVKTIVHFETTENLPTTTPVAIDISRGFFVESITGTPNTTTSNGEADSTTLRVTSLAGFPAKGLVTVEGKQYSYTGTLVSGGTNSLTGVSPKITVANNIAVTVVGFKITDTYTGSALTFSNVTTGTHNVLWDGSELEYCGWWQVASVNGDTITIKDVDSHIQTIPKQFPDRALFATDTKDVPVLLGVDGNMSMTSGNGPVPYLNVVRRLGMAINATMRVTDVTIETGTAPNFVYPYANFVPWLMAQSESSTGGTLYVKQPRAEEVVPSLQVTTPSDKYKTYINSELAVGDAKVSAAVTRYPSRVLLSYKKYPEIFSNPFGDLLVTSDSLIDINAADGQEITGVIPFFGLSAFDAAQQSGVLVVFKTNSIHLVNVNTREVQKLETQGLGCTAPYSITSTKNGIAFANESGIYVLRGNYNIEYVGRFMERNWQERVDLEALSVMQGHHYGIGKQYKLSVPMVENSIKSYAENEEVYVYAYTAEAEGNLGGWTRYTNHAATGWCNLFQDAFFADVNGTVQRIRNSGEASDYRDGSEAIESIVETRATAFENTAIRKAVSNVVVHYRTNVNSESTTLGMAIDMATEYQLSTAYKVVTASAVKDGMSSTVGQSVTTIMHSFPKRKCLYAGVQIVNNGKDENVEIAGMSYVVAGLSGAGVKQAAETEG